jgi:hypothetical protein
LNELRLHVSRSPTEQTTRALTGTHTEEKMASKDESTSPTNSMGSLKSLVSSLRKVSTPTSQHSDHSLLANEPFPDELPYNKVGLDARLNYHLAELDRIRKLVIARNEDVKELSFHAHTTASRQQEEMPRAVAKAFELVEDVRQSRNGLIRYVDFHQRQIRRIARRREEIDIRAGQQPTTSQMYKDLEREEEWMDLFSV